MESEDSSCKFLFSHLCVHYFVVLKMLKSSRAYVFYKGDVLQNVAKLTEKYVYQSLFLIKLSLQLYLKKTPTEVFYCEFFKIIKGNFFIKHLRPAASER